MASWQSLIDPIVSPEASGLLPREDWGTWVPQMTRRKILKADYAQHQPRQREVICHHCDKRATVPARALSALCPHCYTHLQMGNIVLKEGGRRTHLRTQGDVLIPSDITVSGLNVVCNNLIMKGKGDGLIHCRAKLCVYGSSTMTQAVRAGKLELRLFSHLQVEKGIYVEDAEIRGDLTGFIHATGVVRIRRGGVLRGDCRALVLKIDAGGVHEGHFEQL